VEICDVDECKKLFYSGGYYVASINAFAYDHPQGNSGVAFGIEAVLFVEHGEPFSGGPSVTDAFGDLAAEYGDGEEGGEYPNPLA
jgi:hypothetical protein